MGDQKRPRGQCASSCSDSPGNVEANPGTHPHLRIGLIGCGWFTRRAHIPALLKLQKRSSASLKFTFSVVAIWSRSKASRERAAHMLPHPPREYETYTALLQGDDIDAVVIALPIHIQPTVIKLALEAGKQVISEKPAASSTTMADTLWQTFNDSGVSWSVLENWSFKPGFRRLSELIKHGTIGEVASYSATLSQSFPAREEQCKWRFNANEAYEGGNCLDVGVHLVRVLRELFGEVVSVQATRWDEVKGILHGKVVHEGPAHVGGIHGIVELELTNSDTADKARERASGIAVNGQAGQKLFWRFAPSEITVETTRFAAKTSTGGSVAHARVEKINGDSWTTGGVREVLLDALSRCARPDVRHCSVYWLDKSSHLRRCLHFVYALFTDRFPGDKHHQHPKH